MAVPAVTWAASAQRSPARLLTVLGIESSCDDTAAAVVTSAGEVLGESICGQAEVHAEWGGVVPNLAQQAHRAAIDRVVEEALARAGVAAEQLDAVAVTVGPGLSLCLDVGVRKARQVARAAALPLVPVHHMEAHALVARLAAIQHQRLQQLQPPPQAEEAQQHSQPGGQQQQQEDDQQQVQQRWSGEAAAPADPFGVQLPFPFLCLLVSGGHNLLLLVHGVGDYTQLGSTLDDALGEAYDKVARMLGLPLNPHGGAALEAAARSGDPNRYPFALPMRQHANCDFSYAGLKTSVRMCIERELGATADDARAGVLAVAGVSAPAATAAAAAGEGVAAAAPAAEAAPDASDAETDAGGAKPAAVAARQRVVADIAASFQRVAVAHLVARVKRGVGWARDEVGPALRQLVVAGGVASNQVVRQQLSQLAEAEGLQLVLPPPRWCTDNGVMVAWAGLERLQLGLSEPPPQPLPGGAAAAASEWVSLHPRWPLTSRKHARSMGHVLSMKAPSKLHTSLTDLTQQALQQARQQEPEQQQQQGAVQPQAEQPQQSEQQQQQPQDGGGAARGKQSVGASLAQPVAEP